ncbi:DNA-binding transcriptional MerR regulator [Pseudonocardia hierapolitana]|uniref:DNA-binding transcriptional MerR regulator n=1 Tax=Pseudonocardia hierapolitana TaxID=1128676 RepID=A0A561SN50_9PSEU|nr:DNA-binding transcriptional MerR regulator [Pseudonocardia hierapolitana]
MTNNLGRLDDEDYPSVAMGQAAELLGVQPAFLRSLDNAGVLQPHRTGGGHRRYSRRQLAIAARLRELLDDGHPLASARAISGLEDRLRTTDDALEDARADLRDRDAELRRTRAELRDARRENMDRRGAGETRSAR